MAALRVQYRNPLDGHLRVLVGGLTKEQADDVMEAWGNPKRPETYMGPDTAIAPCDGTPDGAVITITGSAA